MFKKIIVYIVVFLFVGATSYFLQVAMQPANEVSYKLLVQKAYLFLFVFSLVLVIVFKILAQMQSAYQQLGFLYMGSFVFKLTVFSMLFYAHLLGDSALHFKQRALLLIPVGISLVLEVFFVSKIISNKKA